VDLGPDGDPYVLSIRKTRRGVQVGNPPRGRPCSICITTLVKASCSTRKGARRNRDPLPQCQRNQMAAPSQARRVARTIRTLAITNYTAELHLRVLLA